MSRRNWINLFSNSQAIELSSDLERGYEAALLIQSLELEYYGDRQIRPELKLSVPRSVQATILRRFKPRWPSAAIQQQLSRNNGANWIPRSCVNFN